MASNFFGLLEDVSSNDPVEIAKKRQQEAVVAKKNAEKKEAADKQAQHQKDQQTSSAAKKTVEKKPAQRGIFHRFSTVNFLFTHFHRWKTTTGTFWRC